METITVTIKKMPIRIWALAKSMAALKRVSVSKLIQTLIHDESNKDN